MKKIILPLMIIFLIPLVLSSPSIISPNDNDIITYAHGIELETSGATDVDCYFSYNLVKNVSVLCNGITAVDIPRKDGEYNLSVVNGTGLGETHTITLKQPDGVLIAFLYLSMFILFFSLVWLFLNAIGHLALLDFDLEDLAKNWGAYFSVLLLHFLVLEYLAIPSLNNLMGTLVIVAGITNGFIPLLALAISFLVGSLIKKKANVNIFNPKW